MDSITLLIQALLVTLGMSGLKWMSTTVDAASPGRQRFILMVIAAIVTVVNQQFGWNIPTDFLHVPGEVWLTALSGVAALVAHWLRKLVEPFAKQIYASLLDWWNARKDGAE